MGHMILVFYLIVWANFETILWGGGIPTRLRVLTIADESKACTRLVYLGSADKIKVFV